MTTTLSVVRTRVRADATAIILDLMVDATEQILVDTANGTVTLSNPNLLVFLASAYDGNRFRIVRAGGLSLSVVKIYNAMILDPSIKDLLPNQWAEFVWTETETKWRLVGFGNL